MHSPAVLATCILHALHEPDAQDGVPAMVGGLYLAEAAFGVMKLAAAYTKEG